MNDAQVIYVNGQILTILSDPKNPDPRLNPFAILRDDDESLRPKFAVTHNGFRCYSKTTVEPFAMDPELPHFTGYQVQKNDRPPRYQIRIKL